MAIEAKTSTCLIPLCVHTDHFIASYLSLFDYILFKGIGRPKKMTSNKIQFVLFDNCTKTTPSLSQF